jgi:ribosomal-protein-alanine N-acetyltransferase
VLRPPRPSDVGALRASLRENVEHLRPWTPAAADGADPLSLTELARGVARARRDWTQDAQYTLLVTAREPDEPIVGRIALTVMRSAFQNAYVGYWVHADRQGQGLATEALGLAIELAFGPLGLHRLQAAIMPRNLASQRVVAHQGFRREGLAERYLQIAGRWEDHLLFALTLEEWERRRSRVG